MSENNGNEGRIVSRIGITPVGSAKYRVNRLRFHLLAYTIARKAQLAGQDARFIIRCDDTNTSNTDRSFLDGYLQVLFFLDIVPNLTPYDMDPNGFTLFQSERGELYQTFVGRLLDSKLAYRDSSGAIFFDPAEFSNQFQCLLADNKLSVFDVAMGDLSVDIRSPLKDRKGRMGLVPFPLVRSNGEYLFNLCSPVDDGVMGVTHVVRDRDKLNLLSNQEMIRISLGFPPLKYIHAPLLVTKDGKRFVSDACYGDATYQDFVTRGILPQAMVSYLLSGVAGPSERYYSSIDEFASEVDFTQVHQSSTVFSSAVLEQHNKKALGLSSASNYEAALKDFLAINSPEAFCAFEADPHLSKMIVRMRRSFSESCKIIESLLSSRYDIPDAKHIRTLNSVLLLFLGDKKPSMSSEDAYMDLMLTRGTDHAKQLGLSKKEYYKAIRYILTGKYQGCDLHDIVWYFEQTGAIESRLKMAEDMLLKLDPLCVKLEE